MKKNSKNINCRSDIDTLCPSRFCMLAEIKYNGQTLDVVELERHPGNDFHPHTFISAQGQYNNFRDGLSLSGEDGLDSLLEYCREEGYSLLLNTDFAYQQRLRMTFDGYKSQSSVLDKTE